jgi:hypothetical protein
MVAWTGSANLFVALVIVESFATFGLLYRSGSRSLTE